MLACFLKYLSAAKLDVRLTTGFALAGASGLFFVHRLCLNLADPDIVMRWMLVFAVHHSGDEKCTCDIVLVHTLMFAHTLFVDK